MSKTAAAEVKERPILFSGPMVRAILEGRKTQTRRVIKPQVETISEAPNVRPDYYQWKGFNSLSLGAIWLCSTMVKHSPYQIGQRLWVREAWAAAATRNLAKPSELRPGEFIAYRATYSNDSHFVWRPSIFMPRWASRVTLEIIGVRVERLQDISEEDAAAEGVPKMANVTRFDPIFGTSTSAQIHSKGTCRYGFQVGWDRLNAKRGYSWESNPWVWVIQFPRIKPEATKLIRSATTLPSVS